MSDRYVELDGALERMVVAAREHLAAVKAADGAPDDDTVWHAYVGLNNAAYDYDELLNDAFGEVTPWDIEVITDEDTVPLSTMISSDLDSADLDRGPAQPDPYPAVVSVRQRRDYRVPSVAALVRLAEEGRPELDDDRDGDEPNATVIETVAEAILELLQSGDGSLAMLDVPELEPLDGVVLVAEVHQALDPSDPAQDASFALGADDRVVGRLNEQSIIDIDD